MLAALAHERVHRVFDEVYGLGRLTFRSASGSIGVSELLSVRDTLPVLPALANTIEGTELAGPPLAETVSRPDRNTATDLRTGLTDVLAEDLPKMVT